MGLAPQTAPPRGDLSSFYNWEVSGAPRANGPDDMPRAGFGEGAGAEVGLEVEDFAGAGRRRETAQYMPVVTALTEANGKHFSDYVDIQSGMTFTADVWRDVDALRKRDPKALKDLPATQVEYEQQQADKWRDEQGKQQLIARRSSWPSYLTGMGVASLLDPVNMATAPIGGLEGGIAKRVLSAAAVNAGTALIEQPIVATERAQRGEHLTLGEAAANVGSAGVVGAGIHLGLAEPVRLLTGRLAKAGRTTETENAALNVLDRQDEVHSTSPFEPGAGSELHATKLQRAMNDLATGRPPPVESANPAMVSRTQVKAMIGRAENPGGGLATRNPASSATGPYQITDPTWISYWKRRYGRGTKEADILAQRSDPAVVNQLMDDMLADNSAALARTGFRQSAGNLYLMHFAGQGGALKILEADAATPIENLLGAHAIEANPFLKGRTAGDVIQWAHAKMGGGAEAPALRKDGFSTNEEWSHAQAQLDAAEADRLATEARARVGEATGDQTGAQSWSAIDPREEPASWQILDNAQRIEARPSDRPAVNVEDLAASADKAGQEKARWVPPNRSKPSDLLEFLSDRGGLAIDRSHALTKGGIDLRTGRRRSGLEWHLVRMPGAGSLVRKGGMSLEQAAEAAAEHGFFKGERPTEREMIDAIQAAIDGEKIYATRDQVQMEHYNEKKAQAQDYKDYADHLSQVLDLPKNDPIFEEVMWRAAHYGDPWRAFEEVLAQEGQRFGQRLAQETGDHGYDWVPGFGDEPPYAVGRTGLPAGFEDPATTGGGDLSQGGGGFATASRGSGSGEATGPLSGTSGEALTGFDNPATGPSALAVSDSLEHDIRMELAAAETQSPKQLADDAHADAEHAYLKYIRAGPDEKVSSAGFAAWEQERQRLLADLNEKDKAALRFQSDASLADELQFVRDRPNMETQPQMLANLEAEIQRRAEGGTREQPAQPEQAAPAAAESLIYDPGDVKTGAPMRTVQQVIGDLDREEAGIEAAMRCMAPPGAAT